MLFYLPDRASLLTAAAPWLSHISDDKNAAFVIKLPGKNDHIVGHELGPFPSFVCKVGRLIL
jgi:hypothetical protein